MGCGPTGHLEPCLFSAWRPSSDLVGLLAIVFVCKKKRASLWCNVDSKSHACKRAGWKRVLCGAVACRGAMADSGRKAKKNKRKRMARLEK